MRTGRGPVPNCVSVLIQMLSVDYWVFGTSVVTTQYVAATGSPLVIAGAINTHSVIRAVDRAFGPVAPPRAARSDAHTIEPPQEGPRTIELRRPGDIQQIRVGYHIPPPTDLDFAAIQVLASLLGQVQFSVLHSSLVSPGLATSAFASVTFRRDPGLVIFGVEIPNRGSRQNALATMVRVLEQQAARFSEANVAIEKRRARTEMDDVLNTTERLALEIGDWASMGDWRLFFLDRHRLEAVTSGDVARVARKYLVATNRTVAEFVPEPSAPLVHIAGRQDLSRELSGYTGHGTFTPGCPC